MNLLEIIEKYNNSMLPMHMPGHKRNISIATYLKKLAADIDITEIDGFDDLHHANGILHHGMEQTASLWGSRRAFWLVNGSTCGILAGIYASLTMGDKVICARNCHKSVYNGLNLVHATPFYILPEADETTGICGPISVESIENAMKENPDAKLVIITSPTYEGVVSDISKICRVVHQKGIPLLVDEAHGSHLGFGYGFPNGAVSAGADIVIHSLHKTLPSLTQTAVLHLNGNLVNEQRLANALSIFETSSPSYLLMSSISGCVNLLEEHSNELFTEWQNNLQSFYCQTSQLQKLSVINGKWTCDPSKIVISTAKTGMRGLDLVSKLRDEHNIEVEMAAENYCVAMTGMGDTSVSLSKFSNALLSIDKYAEDAELLTFPKMVLPKQVFATFEADKMPKELIPLYDAQDRISAETVWVYPPGMPLILPGEIISYEILIVMESYIETGIELRSTDNNLPKMISVISKHLDES